MFEILNLDKPVTAFAHELWKEFVLPGDIVVDATCGNGRDTLFLAKETPCSRLYALDIQAEAIASSQVRLQRFLEPSRLKDIVLMNQCHSTFPLDIPKRSAALIVYNLGYLPGGIKSRTTRVETTLKSIAAAQELIKEGGVISIACYPGHPEGKLEEEALLDYVQTLKCWNYRYYRNQLRKTPPSLLIIKKLNVTPN